MTVKSYSLLKTINLSKEINMTKFYAIGDHENLSHETELDAVTDFISDTITAELPKTVEVQAYTRVVIDPSRPTFDRMFLDIIEEVDEDYGEDGGSEYIPCHDVINKWNEFKTAIIKDYPVWQCEKCGPPTIVNICDYTEG
jgi:hypothetical protein